jgi:hypothetical protein
MGETVRRDHRASTVNAICSPPLRQRLGEGEGEIGLEVKLAHVRLTVRKCKLADPPLFQTDVAG